MKKKDRRRNEISKFKKEKQTEKERRTKTYFDAGKLP
jgi:hypothetical protein